MTTDSTINLFAYGSNLHLNRMKKRVPSSNPIEIGFVRQRKFVFHKRSLDGSAKADATSTSDSGDRVWGVIYQIDAVEKPVLDKCEFLGIGYDQEQVEVVCSSRSMMAWMYVARRDQVESSLEPYCWYVDFVVRGAYQHQLPLCYINSQLSVRSMVDSDVERREANRRVLLR